jgi:hypothetical protein
MHTCQCLEVTNQHAQNCPNYERQRPMYDEIETVMTCPGCGADVDVVLTLVLAHDSPQHEQLVIQTTTTHNHGPKHQTTQAWMLEKS